jgi:hypothetical protein
MSKSRGQRGGAGRVHRGVRGGHLPHLPHVPGAVQEGGDFREAGITGPYNFLHRLWDSARRGGPAIDPGVEQKLHATIKKVTEDLEALSTTPPSRR